MAGAAAAKGGIPATCPSASMVRSTLKLKINAVMSNTQAPEYPYGSPALPKARPPRLVETCIYAENGSFTSSSNIVPITISFAEQITTKDFNSARKAASLSVKPIKVKGLGDQAWLVNPPKYDPRSGSSLFVLSGTNDIVIAAPPTAKISDVETLAHKLIAYVNR
jgi:hypothetical protein